MKTNQPKKGTCVGGNKDKTQHFSGVTVYKYGAGGRQKVVKTTYFVQVRGGFKRELRAL
jgi:hypothetical protein